MQLNSHAKDRTYYNRSQNSDVDGIPIVLTRVNIAKAADHDDITMGKVQHSRNTVNHGISQGNNRVNTPRLMPLIK